VADVVVIIRMRGVGVGVFAVGHLAEEFGEFVFVVGHEAFSVRTSAEADPTRNGG
jgi:hypothetical protein